MTQRKLLVISPDPKIVRQLNELAGASVQVVAGAPGGLPGNFRTDGTVALLIVDQAPNMPIADAVRVLELAQEQRPDVRRGLLTGYADVGEIVGAVHTEAAQFVLHRPIVPAELLLALSPRAVMAGGGGHPAGAVA